MTDLEKAQEICSNNVAGCARNCTECINQFDLAKLIKIANWKDEQFWSYENIERIIMTYKSFPDRSCPHTLIKMTIEKLKPKQ